MDADLESLARTCLDGAEGNTLAFPQIVSMLTAAGFDGYLTDFRRAVITYYLSGGECLDLASARTMPVAAHFDASIVKQAIREAQAGGPSYTYKGFCAKVAEAGCAGYLVSFSGRRVLYFGRTGDTHVEHFPDI